MPNEISVNGNKKLKTLYKEFNKNFPYIRLRVYPMSEKGKSSQSSHNSEKRISEVRTKTSPGDISIWTHSCRESRGEFRENLRALCTGLLDGIRWIKILHHWCSR